MERELIAFTLLLYLMSDIHFLACLLIVNVTLYLVELSKSYQLDEKFKSLILIPYTYTSKYLTILHSVRSECIVGSDTLVILVHDNGTNRSQWIPFMNILEQSGKFDVLNYDLEYSEKSFNNKFNDFASRLIQKISIIGGKYKRIVLVGNSLGGLVVSETARMAFSERYIGTIKKELEKIDTVITVGTPFNGSVLDTFEKFTNISFGSTYYNYLKDTNNILITWLENQTNVHIHFIALENDRIVPLTSAIPLENHLRSTTFSNANHFTCKTDERVLFKILDIINDKN
jgi:hypothetical protein